MYIKNFSAGNIDLKRLKDIGSQGTSYVFKLADSLSVSVGRGTTLVQLPEITILPNPFTGQTVISATGMRGQAEWRFNIYDLNGKRVSSHLGSRAGRVVLDAKRLSAGIFIVELKTPTQSYRKKAVLVR